MQGGFYQKSQPWLHIFRRPHPNQPVGFNDVIPPVNRNTRQILDGMVIVKTLVGNGYIFDRAGIGETDADDVTREYFIAHGNNLDEQTDVRTANRLVGLSCAYPFELGTYQFRKGVPYPLGAPLTYGVDDDGEEGLIVPAEAGDVIIGYVSGDEDGPIDMGGPKAGTLLDVPGQADGLVINGYNYANGMDTMLRFRTDGARKLMA